MRNFIRRKPKCCECGQAPGGMVQWADKPAQWVCFACAWEWGYVEYCYESCRVR